MNAPSRPALRALTGLRFFAALHVVIYHALRPALVDAATPWARIAAAGPTAVTLFFVLSGFVLTYAHPGDVAARPFYRARFARIAPMYWLALAVALPIGALARAKGIVHDPLGAGSLALVATGLQAWVPDAALRWNAPAWSLSCELFFYVCFPFVAPALGRMSRVRAGIVVAALWLAALALVGGAAFADAGVAGARITDEGTWLAVLKFSPLVRAPEFVVGMFAGRLFVDGTRVPSWLGVAGLVLPLVLAAAGVVPYVVLHDGLCAPLFALAVVWLAGASPPLLSSKPAVLLGDASYALYLLHVPMMLWAAAFAPAHVLSPQAAMATGMLCIPVAIVAYLVVERPARQRLRGPVTAAVTS